MAMTSGISASVAGIHAAMARFDAAAAVVAKGVSSDTAAVVDKGVSSDTPDVASDGNPLDTTVVTMITARLAFRVSLEAASASLDMLGEAINIGAYGRASLG
jgi:hypothetical protein